jgi:hypothetical protein
MAFAWGLLEAVTLFIVPDTWISRRALISSRAGLVAAYSALPGAMIGRRLTLYLAATRYHHEIMAFYDWLPGIGPNFDSQGRQIQLEQNGAAALFLGGYTGTPFKLYRGASPARRALASTAFVAVVSLISRGSRFLFSTFVAHGLGVAGRRAGVGIRALLWLHVVVWTLFYAWYWWRMWE